MQGNAQKETTLSAFAEEVLSRHCWGTGSVPCTLTREQASNIMRLGISLAAERGYDNGGTGQLGMHPSAEVPLTSFEQWDPSEHTWCTVVMAVDWEKSTARFHSLHTGTTWGSGCEVCRKLRTEYHPEKESED